MKNQAVKELIKGVTFDDSPIQDDSSATGRWRISQPDVGLLKVHMKMPEPEKAENMVGLKMPEPSDEEVHSRIGIPSDLGARIPTDSISNINRQMPIGMNEMDSILLQNQHNQIVQEALKCVLENTNGLAKQLESFKTRERKKLTGHVGIESPNGQTLMKINYDDGSYQLDNLIGNWIGPTTVSEIKRPGRDNADYYWVHYSSSNKSVIGKIKGLSAGRLYSDFSEAGALFNEKFSASQIGRALYNLFAYRIKHTENTVSLEDLGGWFQGVYLTKDNFPFKHEFKGENLPVLQKTLSNLPLTKDVLQDYIIEVQSITDEQDRKILMVYPYVGILSSLLEKAGRRNEIVLNIIPYEKLPLRRIGNWLYVTERKQLNPMSADVKNSLIKKTCASVKDETLFLDFRMTAESNHIKAKIDKFHAKVVEAFLGNYSINETIHPMALVTISNALYPGNNVCNILLGKDSVRDTETNSDTMRCVYANFIHFVERHINEVEEFIAKSLRGSESSAIIFEVVLEIVKCFWENKGVSLEEILGINYRDKSFTTILQERSFDEEELLKSFVQAVRSEAHNFRFLKSDDKTNDGDAIRYDREHYWISFKNLEAICKAQGLTEYLKEIRLALKDEGILRTDADGMTRKLQINGQRREFYQLRREAFEKIGQTPVYMLGIN